MSKVYKYHLPMQDEVTISLPADARVLTVHEQNNAVYIWAVVLSLIHI